MQRTAKLSQRRAGIVPALLLLASSIIATPTHATTDVTPEEVVAMPVAQLAALLEARWIEAGDQIALWELARTHALAFAQKTEVAMVRKHSPVSGWRYYIIDPFADAVAATDARQQQLAYAHVEPAKVFYRAALANMPNAMGLRFQYARLLEESGARDDAITQYRRIIEAQHHKQAAGDTVTDEALLQHAEAASWYAATAARHLIPLLDGNQDGEEIRRLRLLQ
jgi:hypothetical protein